MSVLRLGLAFAALASCVASVTVTVSVNTTYQTIDGFGFSQAFGHAYDVMNLPAAQAKATLDILFNVTTGAGLTILRNRIGSGGVGDSIEPVGPSSPTGTANYTWDGVDACVSLASSDQMFC